MTLARDRERVLGWLQIALELEWGTIPPYLMALLSLHRDHNRTPAELIRSVMVEEMLHMTLVGNLTSSLSGQLRMDASNTPSYPLQMTFEGNQFRDRRFDIHLGPFSPSALDTFLKIELPADLATHEVDYIREERVPGLTIGDFYHLILDRLHEMCDEYGEAEVFSGDPDAQVGQGYYWSGGGAPVVVKDLATAVEAIEEIVEQGEGAQLSAIEARREAGPGSPVPHYFRFREIEAGKFYRTTDDLRGDPTGDEFEVDYAAVYPLLTNPSRAAYAEGTPLATLNDSFNRAYTLMLIQIREALNGEPRTLYTAIMDGMQTLTSIAAQMIVTPIEGSSEHGAPSFEWVEP